MVIDYHKSFKKAFRKQPKKIQNKFFEKLEVFTKDKFHYSLNNHALTGKFLGLRSFDVTGDIRVHFQEVGGMVILINIASHSELYG